ncbi:MAG: hypothetical protein COA32_10245 [Fluviicola sp.]|nr:MAG: hypothetical protein COA32_10245 [Fluviicola sp.]
MNEFNELIPVEKLEIKKLTTSIVTDNSSIKYLAIVGLLIGAAILTVYLVKRERERKYLLDKRHPNPQLGR